VRRDLPWKRLGEVLREHRARGTELVDFDGGEPTLYPRLREAIRRAARLGYRQINLTTNGRRLADPKFARLLLKTPLTSLLISLHGPTPEIHDALTGVPGSFAETLAGLRNAVAMKAAATDLGVNVTVAKGNVDALAALAARVFDEGVRKLNLQLLTPFGSAGAAVVPDPDRAVAAVTAVLDAFGDRMALHVVNATFCRFPGRERFLSSDVQKLGRTMVFVTDEEVNLFAYLAGRRVRTAECDRCPHGLVCEGFFDFTAPPTQ
jgi:MoaA/NifB/PqqE/SkfB family radical SAM enzyme